MEDTYRTYFAPWVEMWKVSDALYREFGGPVLSTKFGQVPVGARLKLVQQQLDRGRFEILDENLSEQFWAYSRLSPRDRVVSPDEVDFTPFWKMSSSPK